MPFQRQETTIEGIVNSLKMEWIIFSFPLAVLILIGNQMRNGYVSFKGYTCKRTESPFIFWITCVSGILSQVILIIIIVLK